MSYVDGFVLAVAKSRIENYRKVAELAADVWCEYGALEYRECIAEDVQPGKLTSFPQSVLLKPEEVVVFSWIVYESRAHRDAVVAKVMADPRIKSIDMSDGTADMARMIYGGFETVVER